MWRRAPGDVRPQLTDPSSAWGRVAHGSVEASASATAGREVSRFSSQSARARRVADVVRHGPTGGLAVVSAVLLGYVSGVVPPGGGLDPGWALGLSMAREQGLVWGRDIAFTYGPWGFVNGVVPLSGGLVAAALVLQLLVLTCIAFAVWRLASSRGRWGAFLLAVAVTGQAGAVGYASTFGLAVILLSICGVTGRIGWVGWPLPVGFLAGFSLLVKFNVGVTALAVLAVAAALAGRWRWDLGSAAAGVVAGAGGGWLLAGQPPSAGPSWLRQSIELAGGYSQALGLAPDDRPALRLRWAALAVLATVCVLLLGYASTRGSSTRVQLAVTAMLLLAMASFYLASATRLDTGHAMYLFVAIFVVGVPLAASISVPRNHWVPWAMAAAVAGASLTVGAAMFGGAWLRTTVHPAQSLHAIQHLAALGVSGDDRAAVLDRQRAAIETNYAALIPKLELEAQDPARAAVPGPRPAVITALTGARVHAEPWAVGLVWAHGLVWQPVPVFQNNLPYTASLDQLNADALVSGRTTGILRQSAAMDGKHPLWEGPRYQIQLLCRFRQVATDGVWQALLKGPDRCGAARQVGSVTAPPGRKVPVPEVSDALVVATIAVHDGGPGVTGPHPIVSCDGRDYRLAQGFPSGPLVVDAQSAGWAPTMLPAACRTISANARVDISFSAIPLPAAG